MNGVTYTIKLASGEKVTARIHGAGGLIGAELDPRTRTATHLRTYLGILRLYVTRADAGRALPCYEPKPGHVKAYVGRATPDSDGNERIIDIRGARVVSARWL